MKQKKSSVLEAYEQFLTKALVRSKITKENAYLLYRYVGLCEETGEFGGKLKRLIRDEGGVLTDEKRKSMAYELGDILWYLGQIARLLGFTVEEIMEMNREKLTKRIRKGTVKGKGDSR